MFAANLETNFPGNFSDNSPEVGEYAAEHRIDQAAALTEGMKARSAEFAASGAKIYYSNLSESVDRNNS